MIRYPPPVNLVQSHATINEIETYVQNPENKSKHNISKVAKTEAGLEITLHKKMDDAPTSRNLTFYAKPISTQEGVKFETQNDLSKDNFMVVAKNICIMAINTAKPGTEIDISMASDEQQELLQHYLTVEIEKALEKPDAAFTEDTKPTIKTSLVTSQPRVRAT